MSTNQDNNGNLYLRPHTDPPNCYIILIETEFFKCKTFETLEYIEIDSHEYNLLKLKTCVYCKEDIAPYLNKHLWKQYSIESIRINLKIEKLVGKSA